MYRVLAIFEGSKHKALRYTEIRRERGRGRGREGGREVGRLKLIIDIDIKEVK